jgi:hypothetical protein
MTYGRKTIRCINRRDHTNLYEPPPLHSSSKVLRCPPMAQTDNPTMARGWSPFSGARRRVAPSQSRGRSLRPAYVLDGRFVVEPMRGHWTVADQETGSQHPLSFTTLRAARGAAEAWAEAKS